MTEPASGSAPASMPSAAAAPPEAAGVLGTPATPGPVPASTPGLAEPGAEVGARHGADQFYDSSRPWLIPNRGSAALYFDGLYGPAGRAIAPQFDRHRFITVTGDAFNCGIADYEPGNPVFEEPGILRGFVTWRIDHNLRPRTYVNRANAAQALAELGPIAADPRCLFWIATLDNAVWTAQQLAEELAAKWDAPISASQIWANQNIPGGDWDRSNLFGVW